MPITQGAIRKQRADKKKHSVNLKIRGSYKEAVSAMRKKPTPKNLQNAFKELDRATKSNVVHKNKASRLKSRLAKLIAKKQKK